MKTAAFIYSKLFTVYYYYKWQIIHKALFFSFYAHSMHVLNAWCES
jgi:hypothetical protein